MLLQKSRFPPLLCLNSIPFPLEEDMATHPSVLAWKIPWTGKPGRLQSTGSQRVGHDWSNLAHTHISFHFYHSCLPMETFTDLREQPTGCNFVFPFFRKPQSRYNPCLALCLVTLCTKTLIGLSWRIFQHSKTKDHTHTQIHICKFAIDVQRFTWKSFYFVTHLGNMEHASVICCFWTRKNMKGAWDPILCHPSGFVFLQLCVCWDVSGGYGEECAMPT